MEEACQEKWNNVALMTSKFNSTRNCYSGKGVSSGDLHYIKPEFPKDEPRLVGSNGHICKVQINFE